MSKKRLQELVERNCYLEKQNEAFKTKIISLEKELDNLNENTVISSMNDMKERYDELVNNTVCSHNFYSLQSYYKRNSDLLKSIDVIGNIIYDNVLSLLLFIDNNHYDQGLRDNNIKHNLGSIKDRLQLICEIIGKDDDEWCESSCAKCIDIELS